MSPLVRFQPGDKTIYVPPGTMLNVAAVEAGLPIRNHCGGSGICGKCKVYREGRELLACRTPVDEDVEIFIPRTSLEEAEDSIAVQVKSCLPDPDPDVSPEGGRERRFGVAADIGTTTLAAELFEVAQNRFLGVVARSNPQRAYGDDVLSRIQKVVEEPELLATMQDSIVGAVNGMIRELTATCRTTGQGRAAGETVEVSRLSVAGNSVMELFFHGIDPASLGFAPFTPPVTEFPTRPAGELGLDMSPEGVVETFPLFDGFVGGDIVAGVLATRLCDSVGSAFLIDIGTNGELALWHDGELYVAAAAAGPAFEGGRIEYGMSAVPGAIENVELREDGSLTLRTIGERPAVGLCGSGLIAVAAEMLRHRLIRPSGRFDVKADSPFLSRWKIREGKPAFELVSGSESGRDEAILLTQRDVRQLQLAAGALRAGMRLLLRRLDLRDSDIGTFYVAGGFGSVIRPEHARRLGLLPSDIPLERIRFCGNTSLAGARAALLNPRLREEGIALARRAHHVDLASLPEFATVFAECMTF